MKILTTEFRVFGRSMSLVALIWFFLAALGAYLKIRLGAQYYGNYFIFRNAFWHTIHQTSLYQYYPSEKLGDYLYGPLFSILIAPFALLPPPIGAFVWCIFNAGVLFIAIRKLPLTYQNQQIILVISLLEMMTSIQNMQINCLVAALIILSYTFVKKEKEHLATLFIAAGFLIKIYGIAGIAFFLFSKNKKKFVWFFIFWMMFLAILPAILSSPSWLGHTYHEWFYTLVAKNHRNQDSLWQNISVMGMLKHIFHIEGVNKIVVATATVFYLLPFFRRKQAGTDLFRLTYLAMVLIGVVIFSSGGESPTYIIVMTGIGIWYCTQNKRDWKVLTLLIFAWILTSLSPTDIFPSYLRNHYVEPYSLKALPGLIIWIVIATNLLTKNFNIKKLV
jgi:Glycosyltransferase family 87